MNEIVLLSQETIDRIAAGEVVERPASIVKELVENAVDAGANAVTVEIRDGGTKLVRITDNGCGIPAEQVRIAYCQHATSKIRSVEDLLTSGTLGFRGEALSSIAAVSRVEMLTKTAGSLTGVRYVIEGGAEKEMEEVGTPEGTTFLVRDLFYNTPARRKFLKTPASETGYVSDLMERMALSHPDISFKFISNGEVKLHTSGNHNLKDIIYGVYGRDIAANVVKVDADYGNIRITGFIGKPVISRGNRNYENYFVNGRYVKSAIVARGIEDAYKAFMMNHRYPFTVLLLEINAEEVDVNVHPQKLEVRFANQQEVYEKVCQTVREGLLGKELIPEFTIGGADRPASGKQAAERPAAGREKREAVRAAGSAGGQESAGRAAGSAGGQESAGRAARSADRQEGAERAAGNGSGGQEGAEHVTGSGSGQEGAERAAGNGSGRQEGAEGSTGNSGSEGRQIRYPEPFEKVRSRLIAEANSPYETKYPQRSRAGLMKPVTGSVVRQEDGAAAADTFPPDRQPAGGDVPSTEGNVPSTEGNVPSTEGNVPSTEGTVPCTEGTAPCPVETAPHTEGDTLRTVEGAERAYEAAMEDARRMRREQEERECVQMELAGSKLLAEASRPRHRLIGQVFDTYWIVEFENRMYIIDQHAAHEKVMYERFMKEYREKRQTSQMITPPVIVTLSIQEEQLLERHRSVFESVGFEISPFGGREYAVSAVPGNLYGLADRELFLEILDGLSDVSERASEQTVCDKIASMSCKAAVKGNHRLSVAEADALIGELLALENPYNCPHGRPTIISMSKYELEKKFKRVL